MARLCRDIFDRPEIALRHFSARKYDIAIIDAKMPKISGFELVRLIYGVDKNTRIILMSDSDLEREEFEKSEIASKVDAFMKKPRGIMKLISHIEALLKHKRRELAALVASAGASLMALSFEVVTAAMH
ncbi:response regulator [Candidatus Nitrososphaera evergladensis]|nr:response regulator [Candidatus Nitrososphaera evergladensis]